MGEKESRQHQVFKIKKELHSERGRKGERRMIREREVKSEGFSDHVKEGDFGLWREIYKKRGEKKGQSQTRTDSSPHEEGPSHI